MQPWGLRVPYVVGRRCTLALGGAARKRNSRLAKGCRRVAATYNVVLYAGQWLILQTHRRFRHWRLSISLILHLIGLTCLVFESVPEIKPLMARYSPRQ